jgi:LysR family cys regulon transcriptional activator
VTLDQLRFLCEVAERGFNISRAADALHIAQPWVSKHIAALEQELGIELLRRQRGRIVGLTQPGEEVLRLARIILTDTRAITRLGQEHSGRGIRLIIATTHLHARYILPPVIKRFRREYPKIQLGLVQATSEQTVNLVLSGKADLAVGAAQDDLPAGLVQLTCFALPRCVIVPLRHPLLQQARVEFSDLGRYPLISFDNSQIGAILLNRAFTRHNIRPNVVINATDTEVMKEYVKLGLGIAILPKVAIEPSRDRGLRVIDAPHLFEDAYLGVMLRPDSGVHVCEFAGMIDPAWNLERIRMALRDPNVAASVGKASAP